MRPFTRLPARPCFRFVFERRSISDSAHNFESLNTLKAPTSFWDREETRRQFLDWAATKLRVRSLSDWYDVSRSSIKQLGGGGLLALHYRDSLPTALKALYPSHEWLPWRFKHAPKGFWANQENRIAFFDWCGSQLGINHSNLDAWYSIKRNQVEQLGGDGLLVNYYGHSLTAALADIYPDHRWDQARFLNSSSPSSAIDISAVLSEFAEQRQVKCLEDWYRISSRQWKGHKLAPIIKRHGGLPAVLKLVYPDHKWQLSSFSVLGKKAMQFKLKTAVAQIFPGARIDEDVHTTQIASWKTIRHLEFDLFLPEYNLALEYQGEQHFQATVPTMRTQQHWEQADAEKMALCQRYGICLIDVPFHDWDGSPASIRARILAARPDLQSHMSSSS